MANYGRNFSPDQRFYIGPTGSVPEELRGVQNVAVGWSKPQSPVMSLGRGYIESASEGSLESSVSINRLVINGNDPLTGHLGSMMSGVLAYGANQQFNKSVVFNSGYIASYSSACSIGDVPSADVDLVVYGDIGAGTTGTLSLNTEAASIPVPGNISLDVSGYTTNAVQSYSIEIPISRERINTIGNNFLSTGSFVQLPIEVQASFSMIVKDYEAANIRNFLCSDQMQTLTLNLNACDGSKIRGFVIPSGRFVGFSQDASTRQNMTLSVEYIASFNSLSGLQNIFS